MLKQTAVFHVCQQTDVWEHPTRTDITVQRVCLQPTLTSHIDRDNTVVSRSAELFVDARLSTHCDPEALHRTSLANDEPMTVTINGIERTVVDVRTIMDDEGHTHHWELVLE